VSLASLQSCVLPAIQKLKVDPQTRRHEVEKPELGSV
jgi:hypothetical protein